MEQRPKGWDWTMDINARAYLFLAQKAVPLIGKTRRGLDRWYFQSGIDPGPSRICSSGS